MTIVANSNGRSQTWDSYVSVQDDVMPWMQIPGTDVANPYAQQNLQLITDAVCQWAQKRVGYPIAPHLFQRYFDGDGFSTTIMLPYPPILEIVNVTEYWGTGGPHVLNESYPTNQVDGFECQYPTGRLIRIFPGLFGKPWFPGSRNIYVEYWAGQNPVDADLKMATIEMIAHWYEMTQQRTANRLSSTGAGPSAEEVASGSWTGVPQRIVNLLDETVHIGLG
jgi:hypothetical protein